MLSNIRIVLVNTTHPGNIWATARSMKNMGLNQLYLVQPKFFPHQDATARAAGADDVLEKAKVVATLAEAIAGCKQVFGTSARKRSLPVAILNPRQAAQKAMRQENVAFVFGQERAGLSNDELLCCNYHVYIPTVDDFSSLNLAASVQVIAYELYINDFSKEAKLPYDEFATADEMALFYQHLQRTLIDINFLNHDNPQHVMRRLRRLFNRNQIEKTELNILRGILSSIGKTRG